MMASLCVDGSYSSLSKIFSEFNGITVGCYYILQRMERMKKLVTYDE